MAADRKVFGFNQNDAQQLVNLLGTTGGEVKQFEYDLTSQGRVLHAFTPEEGIPAREELTMGSAVCTVYDCDKYGVLEDSERTITVYNMASSTIAGETHIIATRNAAGLFVCIVEDCG